MLIRPFLEGERKQDNLAKTPEKHLKDLIITSSEKKKKHRQPQPDELEKEKKYQEKEGKRKAEKGCGRGGR